MADESESRSLYPYDPNKGAPIAFAIIVSCLGIALTYLSFFRYHWTYFGSTMIWASAVWVSGFICREISARNVQSVGIFIAQYVMVLMGPPLYAASEYFILGRLLAYLPYHAPIHPGRVISTFLLLSTIVETFTATGASQTAGADRSESQRTTGLSLLNAALIVQCFIEAFFFSLVVTLERRCRKAKSMPRPVRVVCCVLYVTSAMMLVRCIIRTIEGFETASCNFEAGEAYCGPVSRNEWFLWVFEVANITLFVILLTIFHPGRYLPQDDKIYLDPIDGKTERMGPGFSKADKRPMWQTVVDPSNLSGILGGRGMLVHKFWEEHQPIYDDTMEAFSKDGRSSVRHRSTGSAPTSVPSKA